MNKYLMNVATAVSVVITFCSSMVVIAAPQIEIEDLRAILPPSVANTTAIYGEIKNIGDEVDTLIGVRSNAGNVMLHQTKIVSGHAQMNHIATFEIKPYDALTLKPMSYHLMLMGINHDVIKKKGQISLVLEFKRLGELVFIIPVLFD